FCVSSRRRHTRFSRDWSSDVCSSDLRLPASLKLAGGEGKLVLKKAMEPLLPHDVLYRAKMGFAVPLVDWFRGPLRGEVERVLKGEALAGTGIFDARALARIADEHLAGTRDRSAKIGRA